MRKSCQSHRDRERHQQSRTPFPKAEKRDKYDQANGFIKGVHKKSTFSLTWRGWSEVAAIIRSAGKSLVFSNWSERVWRIHQSAALRACSRRALPRVCAANSPGYPARRIIQETRRVLVSAADIDKISQVDRGAESRSTDNDVANIGRRLE